MSLTIEVAEITPPAYGKKQSIITTANGETFYAYPDNLFGMLPGGRYAIEFKTSTYRGKDYRTVTGAQVVNAAPMTNGNGHVSASVSQPDEQKFVTALLAAFISSRQITPTDKALLWETTKNLRGLWSATFGGKTNGSTSH